MTHLITGATGDVGSRVVRQLLEQGVRPRVLARSEEKARALFADRADIYQGDLSDPASTRAAMDGVDSLFLVNIGPQISHRDASAASLAKDAGIARIVKLSSIDVEQGLAIGAWHERGEHAIRACGLPFIFIRPSGFMNNLLAWAQAIRTDGIVRSSTGDGHRPFIHSDDIASVCVAALLTDKYVGQALPLTGPQPLTFADATEILGRAIGRSLVYAPISDQEARERYARVSGSTEETEAHVALWRAIREGRLGATTSCVEQILARKPIALEQWAAENATAFLN